MRSPQDREQPWYLDPLIDFDDIDAWHSSLTQALRSELPASTQTILVAAKPRYIEDACELVLELGERDALIDAVLGWLRGDVIAGFHGSRLSEADVASIEATGLVPLDAGSRRERLARALSCHPRWSAVAHSLDDAIDRHGPSDAAGHREGQAHLTLSYAGLVDGFNHYLRYGSEFDQHVAHSLLGPEGYDALAADGRPTLIGFAVPGEAALNAAHPHFTIDDVRRNGDLPNIADEFLKAWSYKLAHPAFQSSTLKIDCGLVFRDIVPSDWLFRVEDVNERLLSTR